MLNDKNPDCQHRFALLGNNYVLLARKYKIYQMITDVSK